MYSIIVRNALLVFYNCAKLCKYMLNVPIHKHMGQNAVSMGAYCLVVSIHTIGFVVIIWHISAFYA